MSAKLIQAQLDELHDRLQTMPLRPVDSVCVKQLAQAIDDLVQIVSKLAARLEDK